MSMQPLADISNPAMNAENVPKPAPFTPVKMSLLKELDMLPPATPTSPDILTGRGYGEDEVSRGIERLRSLTTLRATSLAAHSLAPVYPTQPTPLTS